MVPCSATDIASDGGVAIHPNTDTINPVVMILVDQQGLAGLDVPHPE